MPNLSTFHGLPVQDFQESGDITDFSAVAPRICWDYDHEKRLSDCLSTLLEEPNIEATRALVLGMWAHWDSEAERIDETIELLIANKDKFPNLTALFVGDISSEENEISWIENSDMSAIWAAFPELEEFGARGGNGLRLGKINHSRLKKLVIETGGISAPLVREALAVNAPLEHLELWFGDENYGLSATIDDLSDLLDDKLFPNLKTLALRNCDFANKIAKRLAKSPLLDRIEHLDLSLGTLRNGGAKALIASGRLGHLKSLDIHWHYIGKKTCKKLAAATPNLIGAKDREEPDEDDDETYYYVAVSE